MISVVQVVSGASVEISGLPGTKRSISSGLVVYLGISGSDTEKEADITANKVLKLRIFPDDQNKMNKSIQEHGGQILLISQFTLIADLKGNNRPSFTKAADKSKAESLYQFLSKKFTDAGITTATGYFGENMVINQQNAGPATIILDTDKL